jgi:SAM-dependent methyltransferase
VEPQNSVVWAKLPGVETIAKQLQGWSGQRSEITIRLRNSKPQNKLLGCNGRNGLFFSDDRGRQIGENEHTEIVIMLDRIYEKHLSMYLGAEKVKRFLDLVHYDHEHWTRPVMHRECVKLLRDIGMEKLEVLEISAGGFWKTLPFKSFREANYPEFDICKDRLDGQFDLIIADQVFEHLLWPYRATRNVHSMLRSGGYFLVVTPFLIKYHPIPHDCSRWTETGMKYFLAECGFDLERVKTGSWGNRACVRANFKKWARAGWFGSLQNEPEFPVTVWALANKS